MGTSFLQDNLIPKQNLEVYSYLFLFENAVRELIIDLFQVRYGERWYKKRLPPDVLDKFRKAIEHERNIKWIRLIPHHPIYYLDFPDLKKIIDRIDNWEEIFKDLFGTRKEVITNIFSELEPIRNRVAHNRKAVERDLFIVKEAHSKLSEMLGNKRMIELSSRCTSIDDVSEQLAALRKEGDDAFTTCIHLKPVTLRIWKSIRDKWWFDETYLGHDLNAIIDYFNTIDQYTNLSRGRGSGHTIESWLKTNNIESKYLKAKDEFAALSAEGGTSDGFK
jgi:hypothetical protein